MKSKTRIFLIFLPFILACGFVSFTPVYVVSETQTPTVTATIPRTIQATNISPEKSVLCVSAAESLNLRLAPSTSAAADPKGLQHGDRVERIGAAPGWYKIVTADGRSGWVKASYLEGCDGT